MTFDARGLLRFYAKVLFASRGTDSRITKKRALILTFFFPFLMLVGLVHLTGFLLDDLFFRGYRTLQVKRPVFIVGVFRSGTTFLHRLLAKDTRRFTSMRLWEILFAPSITEKKLLLAMGKLDRRLGSPLCRRILAWEDRTFHTLNRLHKLSLFEPEEDDPVLLNIFSSFFQYFGFPMNGEPNPFVWFDTRLSSKDRARIMGFYKRCVQRHLYVFGPDKQFLSKNPVFSPKVRSLGETFPDARVICMVRSPLAAVPSTFSLFSLLYRFVNSPLDKYPMREATLEMISHWYRYPVAELEQWPVEKRKVLTYDTLVGDNPGRVVLELYQRFGFKAEPAYRRTLEEEDRKARGFRSEHAYRMEEIGLDPVRIVREYRDIFERYGFDTEGYAQEEDRAPCEERSPAAA